MKKNLKVVIVVAIIVLVIAIGIIFIINSNKKSNTTKEGNNKIQLGDTILLYKNEMEFTLTDIEFANYYYNNQNDLFLTKCESGEKEKKTSQIDKTFLLFSAKVKYLGKEKNNYSGIGGFMTLDYNNGYTFKPQNVYLQQNNSWKNTVKENETSTSNNMITFEPLDKNEYICRGYFEVPKEVRDNTNEPLVLNIKQTDIDYKLDIRK